MNNTEAVVYWQEKTERAESKVIELRKLVDKLQEENRSLTRGAAESLRLRFKVRELARKLIDAGIELPTEER